MVKAASASPGLRIGVLVLATLAALLLFASGARAYIYWSENDYGADGSTIGDSIWRSNLDGHGGHNLNESVTWAGSLTLAGKSLYFDVYNNGGPPGIGRMGIDGSGLETTGQEPYFKPFMSGQFTKGDTNGGELASDGAHLYWLGTNSSGASVIGRANLDGSGIERAYITLPGAGDSSIAIGGGYLYWSDTQGSTDANGNGGGTIGRVALDGSGANDGFITLPNNDSAGEIAVDGSHIYWIEMPADQTQPTIGRANLDGSGVNAKFITPAGSGQAGGGGLAVTGSYLYWGQNVSANPSAGIIARANLDGSGDTFVRVIYNATIIGVQVDGYNGNQIPIVGPPHFGGHGHTTCTVPKLVGVSLNTARKRLKTSHCALGTVKHKKGSKHNKGRIVAQSPAPGKKLKAGSRVAVTVGT